VDKYLKSRHAEESRNLQRFHDSAVADVMRRLEAQAVREITDNGVASKYDYSDLKESSDLLSLQSEIATSSNSAIV